jgi:hypothetical protein
MIDITARATNGALLYVRFLTVLLLLYTMIQNRLNMLPVYKKYRFYYTKPGPKPRPGPSPALALG